MSAMLCISGQYVADVAHAGTQRFLPSPNFLDILTLKLYRLNSNERPYEYPSSVS